MTNAPRRWSVRPNGGVLEAGQTVAIALSLSGPKESATDDHHLILTLPLTAEEAARLNEVRATNAKASIEALTQDNPKVSQARLSARLSVEGARNGKHAPSEAPPAADAAADGDMSVAARVKDLQRRYSNGGPAAGAARTRAAGAGTAERSDAAAGCASCAAAAARSDGAAAEGAAADAGALEAEAPARDEEPQHPLLRLASRLLAFLGFGFDEFEPWLKWKVYDVLFALLLVLLGRRLRHPVVQRALEFVGEA